MTETAWTELVDALGAEIGHLDSLRNHADVGSELMLAMDVPGIERWAAQHQSILSGLNDLALRRQSALEKCLPGTTTRVGRGGLAARMSLLSIIQFAPHWVARRLRTMRSRLRELRDEIALVTSRNEILAVQALEFTEELGRSLISVEAQPGGYNALGKAASGTAGAGELLELSL